MSANDGVGQFASGAELLLPCDVEESHWTRRKYDRFIILLQRTQRTKLSQCTRKRVLLLDTWHNYNLITRLNQFYKDIIVIITLE